METKIKDGKYIAESVKMTGSVFHDVCLGDADFDNVSLVNARFNNVNMSNVNFNYIDFSNTEITDSHILGMKINGIPVEDMLKAYNAQKS